MEAGTNTDVNKVVANRNMMRVLEVMKTHVVTVAEGATLWQAIDLMDVYQVSSLPVVDAQGQLCGMLSECDVVRALRVASERTDDETAEGQSRPERIQVLLQEFPPSVSDDAGDRLRLSDVETAAHAVKWSVQSWMTSPCDFISEQTEARHAANTLFERRRKRLPVVDENGRVVGVLNRIDVLQALFERTL